MTTDIYSTDFDSTYGVAAGTSEASPFAAGLAALVRSLNPSYTGLQAGEQVRVTADNIDAVNRSYVGQLGKGRINALRALTVSSPSLRMTTMTVKDSAGGNNNGILEPNETFTIVIRVTNYLQPTTAAATISLVSSDTNVQIVNGSFPIGVVGTMDSASNAAAPFQVHVNSTAAQGHTTFFTLTMADADYSDFQIFTLLINPTFASHNANKVDVTLTNNGRIGFNDFPNNTEGDGFVYPYPGGGNQLFEGGLIIGTSATSLVDAVRNPNATQDADFVATGMYQMQTPGTISDQDGHAVFSDLGAPGSYQVGVTVAMSSYEFKSPADSNYVILRYSIRNRSGAPLANLYAGLFLDWDVLPDYSTNETAYDTVRSLGYAWDTIPANPIYCGVRALDGAAGFRGLINSSSIDLSRAGKWSWLSGGIVPSDSVSDIHIAISEGPFSIAPGDSQAVGFALLGGMDLPSLKASADAASSKWTYIKDAIEARPKITIPIHQNPVLSQFADLYVTSSVGLVSTPLMTVTVGSRAPDTLALSSISPQVYKGSYEFRSSGTGTVLVHALGVGGLDTTISRLFQVQLLKQGTAGTVRAADGNAVLSAPGPSVVQNTYFTLMEEPVESPPPLLRGRAYSFGPPRAFGVPMTIALRYTSAMAKSGSEEHLSIYRFDGKRWNPLESRLNPAANTVEATVTSLGTFAIGYSEGTVSGLLPTAFALEQNFPNPFNPATEVQCSIPDAGTVDLTVFNVLGQEVATLFDGALGPGVYKFTWGGIDRRGTEVATGVYFYRIAVTDPASGRLLFAQSRKMLLVR